MRAGMTPHLQLAEELELLLWKGGNDADGACDGDKKDGRDLGRLAVRQLHHKRAVLEAVHKLP